MPSPRRLRLLMLAAFTTVVIILFYTSGVDTGREAEGRTLQDFYHKTMDAMDGRGHKGQVVLDTQTGNKAGSIPADKDADGDVDDDDTQAGREMQERLKAAEQEAKDKANTKAGLRPDPPSNVIGVGSAAGGQNKKGKGVADAKAAPEEPEKAAKSEDAQKAGAELDSILKKAPVIIFSKTYCPFSKRAKGVLLEKYKITPEPYVVELDEHPLGPFLQDELLERTGRRTVPNVLINGISIGGADDIIDLDHQDKLVGKMVNLGNKRVDVTERFVPGASHA